jgi:hypothetical protein
VVAVPDSGATFQGWSGACSGTAACRLTLNGDTSVNATFATTPSPPGSHRLTVVIEGSGKVNSSPAGIMCDSTSCSAEFPDGTPISLAAETAQGFSFSGWGAGCSGPGACSLVLHGDVEVFAHFQRLAPPPVHLSVAVTGPGHVGGAGIDCGNGGTVCDVTVPASSTATLDATAGANARFIGWGGACMGGAGSCTLSVPADMHVTAAFDFAPQVLVSNDGSIEMAELAINSTDVFFLRLLSDGISIWAVSKSGGTPRQVTSQSGFGMVADDGFVYFLTQDNTSATQALFSAPVSGGESSKIFEVSSQSIGQLVLDNGALYFPVVGTPAKPGSIHRMQNRVDQVIAANEPANDGLAVDASFAYYTFVTPDRSQQGIRRIDKLGRGPVSALFTSATTPSRLRVDSQHVYYRDRNGAIFAVAKDGSEGHLVSGNTGRTTVTDFDINAFVVFWPWFEGTSQPDGIFRANADGSGFAAVDLGNGDKWAGPRVDDTAMFYLHNFALMKRMK